MLLVADREEFRSYLGVMRLGLSAPVTLYQFVVCKMGTTLPLLSDCQNYRISLDSAQGCICTYRWPWLLSLRLVKKKDVYLGGGQTYPRSQPVPRNI